MTASPNEDWTFSVDYVLSHGYHEKDHFSETKPGYVAAAMYGEADPKRAGSYEVWVRYYHLPSSALLAPTMDADTTFFRRMGFSGWGAMVSSSVPSAPSYFRSSTAPV